MVLLGARSLEEIVIRKCLQPSSLANSKAAGLGGIGMDIVVAVLRDVTGNSGRRFSSNLNPKTVSEWHISAGHHISMFGKKALGELGD